MMLWKERLQSRFVCVKCPLDRELLEGRKGKSYGIQTRISLQQKIRLILSPIVVVLMKEVIFLCSKIIQKRTFFCLQRKN